MGNGYIESTDKIPNKESETEGPESPDKQTDSPIHPTISE